MNRTLFETLSLDRNDIHWEDHLKMLTPWENHQGIWFKREDFFAPLGYGGPNGSKMRQLIWYINQFRSEKKTHILTGASIQSPQLSMTAIVGAHYGMRAKQVIYSSPTTVLSHENPQIAAGFGAVFEFAPGPYNPILQRRVIDLTREQTLVVEYGITVPHDKYPVEYVKGFHEVGANQVRNLPEEITELVMPAGSCNSMCSLLLGLSRDSKNLKKLRTMGIGPDKREWVRQRMKLMGVEIDSLPFEIEHHSLHMTGYAAYSDKFKGESFDGIEFHPTYEAKIWHYLRHHDPLDQSGHVGFWIVGSAPNPDVIRPFFTVKPEDIKVETSLPLDELETFDLPSIGDMFA